MRRSTPGLVHHDAERAAELAALEAVAPARIIEVLEPLVGEARRARLCAVLSRRLEGVTALIDRPYDPFNAAALARTCESFGIARLHITPRGGDAFLVSRKITKGSHKWIDVVSHPSGAAAVAALAARGHTLVAARADGRLVPGDLARLARPCVVFGNAREGLDETLAAACAESVAVPMRGFVESLNVSATAAILLHAATEGRAGDLPPDEHARFYARGLFLSLTKARQILEIAGVLPRA